MSNNLRDNAYRALLPFNILFHPEMDMTSIRLYGLIEQLESHPSSKVQPFFSNKWFGDQLGICERQVQKTSKKLKDLGLIGKKQLSSGNWLWYIKRNRIEVEEDFEEVPPLSPALHAVGAPSVQGGVNSDDRGGVNSQFTHKYPEVKHPEEKIRTNVINKDIDNINSKPVEQLTGSDVSVFVSERNGAIELSKRDREKLLNCRKLNREKFYLNDRRDDEMFIDDCLYHLEHKSKADMSLAQKINGLCTIISRYGFTQSPRPQENKVASTPVAPNPKEELIREYRWKLSRMNTNINLGLVDKNCPVPTFEQFEKGEARWPVPKYCAEDQKKVSEGLKELAKKIIKKDENF